MRASKPSIFQRLYAYRERPSVAPLENFLTEATADLFDRLPSNLQRSLIMMMLPASARAVFEDAVPPSIRLTMATQVSAFLPGTSKRPDLVIYAGEQAVILIEAKIGAALQQHDASEKPPNAGADIRIMRNQLESYSQWIAGVQNVSSGWPGSVVFLTAYTAPPNDFVEGRSDKVVRSTRLWRDLGEWILREVEVDRRETTYCAIASDLYQFLEERDLMNKYLAAHDIAAASLFVKSSSVLHDTFYDVIKAVGDHAPKLRGGRRYNADFWTEGNIFWGWFHFARNVKKDRTKPYLAIGICFEVAKERVADAAKLPRHEPFFFLACEDDWETEKPKAFLSGIPSGWVQIDDEWMIVVARPVRDFASDPDQRFEELKVWACSETEKLVACVPGYREASAEFAPVEDDVEND